MSAAANKIDLTQIKETPAVTSARRSNAKMLVIDRASDDVTHETVADLPRLLRAGDVVVVNDAATVPASLSGVHAESAESVELRLLRRLGPLTWLAFLLGRGDWHTPTEERAAPPIVHAKDHLRFASGLAAIIGAVHPESPRLVTVNFLCAPEKLLHELYRTAVPIQYAYHQKDLELWDVQTIFSVKPVAVEAPSAAMHLDWSLVFQLQDSGVEIKPLTHATGISSTGDARIDALLPVEEPYEIPRATAAAVTRARRAGRRVIAVGTGCVRALESAWDAEAQGVRAGSGSTKLRIGASTALRAVTGLLTGMHTADSSHLDLLSAFVERGELARAYLQASRAGYLWHEFGDVSLIL